MDPLFKAWIRSSLELLETFAHDSLHSAFSVSAVKRIPASRLLYLCVVRNTRSAPCTGLLYGFRNENVFPSLCCFHLRSWQSGGIFPHVWFSGTSARCKSKETDENSTAVSPQVRLVSLQESLVP